MSDQHWLKTLPAYSTFQKEKKFVGKLHRNQTALNLYIMQERNEKKKKQFGYIPNYYMENKKCHINFFILLYVWKKKL